MSQIELIPLKFLDSIGTKKHIALLYEEPEYARLIEFRFLKNGLGQGEQCIYATEEDSGTVILKLISYGIPIESFQKGRIRVLHLDAKDGDYESMMTSCKKDMLKITHDLDPPFRIVSRIVPAVQIVSGMSLELEFERQLHHIFDEIGGSVMCPYDLTKMEPTLMEKWLSGIHQTHHDIIFSPGFGMSGVLSAY
ncbi:MAG: MEDS domain-containing protein [Nitrosotalea sp.]